MIGALVGISGIPQPMVEKLLNFDCTEPKFIRDDGVACGIKRPSYLSIGRHALPNIQTLITHIPQGTDFIVDQEFNFSYSERTDAHLLEGKEKTDWEEW